MTTWQEEFAHELRSAGFTIDNSVVAEFRADDTNALIGWLKNWWEKADEAYGMHTVLNTLPGVPAALITIGLESYRAVELLRHAPTGWTFEHLLTTTDEKWRVIEQRWHGVEAMTVGDEAARAAS